MKKMVILEPTSVKGVGLNPGENDYEEMDAADAKILESYSLAKPYVEPVKELTPEEIEEQRQEALLQILDVSAEQITVALEGLEEADLDTLFQAEETGEGRVDVIEVIGAAIDTLSVPKILAGSIAEIEEALPNFDENVVNALFKAEEEGEGREDVLEVIGAAIDTLSAAKILAGSIAEIEEALPGLDLGALACLLETEEKAEKPRKGAIDVINAAIAALEPNDE